MGGFCADHWAALRVAIDDRGLSGLVAKDGETATRQMAQQLTENAVSRETFDPLMAAHWAVMSNAMRIIDQSGNNPLYLFTGGPEDPVEGYGAAYDGRTWPRCPLCYLNLAHEVSCTHATCQLDKVRGYDWMIARAADDALSTARELGLAPLPS